MNERERRLQRLMTLRTQQHDVASMGLRVARNALHEAEAGQAKVRHLAVQAQHDARMAMQRGEYDAWLLGRAETQWAAHTAVTRTAACQAALKEVEAAAMHEAVARRESMQMETVFNRVRHERRLHLEMSEQKRMDESVRILRHYSSFSIPGARSS